MHFRIPILIPISGWLLPAMLAAAPAFAAEPMTLAAAEQMAREANPGLAAADAEARAMDAVPDQAAALPDPVLSLNALNLPTDTFSTTQEPMTQMQVGISQAIPFPGKLALREDAARHGAEAAHMDAEEARLRLLHEVRITWWKLFYLDRAEEIVGRNQQLLRQLVRIAEAKYKTGEGLQQDVLLAQVELSRLLDVAISLQGSRTAQTARLNALLGRGQDNPVVLPQHVDERLAPVPDEAELLRLADSERPALAAQQQRLDASATRVALAEKGYYPDFRIGAAYGVRRGVNPNGSKRADLASIQLSMTLPLYAGSKQSRAVDQRRAEQARDAFRLQDRRRQVEAEVTRSLAGYKRASEQARLFKSGIIPQASQTVASMLTGFQVGKVDFLNLVRSQITLYNYETQYWKALAEANQAYAGLEAAVGREFEHEQ